MAKPGTQRCYVEGAEARRAGKPREACPYSRDQRPQARAWLEGWDSAALDTVERDHRAILAPPRRRREERPKDDDVTKDPRYYAQGDVSRPVYVRMTPVLVPCRECRRIRLDNGMQATIVKGIHGGVAWMFCRACNATFKAPVVELPPPPW